MRTHTNKLLCFWESSVNPEEFVKTIREEFINSLVEEYSNSFSEIEASECKDLSMRPLIELWHASDKNTRDILKMFIRLGSQNSLSSLLSSLDNVSGVFSEEFSLTVDNGPNINGDLLDIFWEQEEISGHVNVKT